MPKYSHVIPIYFAVFIVMTSTQPAYSAGKEKMKPNHLIHEKSPYLLQHAYNPVDWYPWGEEAFRKAREQDKPILLSIGYSTCHWCHVMEHESFSNAQIAAVMNENFVCIKVDREERPDVDRIYMTAVQVMTGSGGWPLNVFLTPDLKPFYGGTYFPPESRWGQPALPQVLEKIAGLWKIRREELIGDSSHLVEAIAKHSAAEGREATLDASWLDRTFESYQSSFDPHDAGFGGAPKFPMPVNQNFLLWYYARTGRGDALKMAHRTLQEMARGGIYDQIGGGFHRYSTDAQWRVPHFEKMLYDNAQLAVNYLETYQATKDPEMARIARETLAYVLRDMTQSEGGFYSAEDADSLAPGDSDGHVSEGAFYLWTDTELKKVLGSAAEIFAYRYGVRPGGNAPADPQGEFRGKNILYAAHELKDTAEKFGVTQIQAAQELDKASEKLLASRSKRPRPSLDDKVLTSWNGLMISAFAKGYQALGDPRYLDAAQNAAQFIRANLYDPKTHKLYHRWRQGARAVEGMSDDYAFLVQGLLDLYESSFEAEWLDWALELTETHKKLFYDEGRGGFYATAEGHDPHLLIRVMGDSDNVEPGANSVASLNLLRLAQFTGREDFRKAAEKTMERFGAQMRDASMSLPQMLVAVNFATSSIKQIVIAGKLKSPGVQEMLRSIHSRLLPAKIVLLVDKKAKGTLARNLPFLQAMTEIQGKPTAYVCVHYACRLPTNDLKVFNGILDEKSSLTLPSP